jgi:hypothetical protein
MLGWLKAKNENSRVWACVKDIKFVLENADPTRRAVILALASSFRMTTLADEHIALQALDRPLDYGRNELMTFYRVLEDARNQSIAEFEAAQRSVRGAAARQHGMRFEGLTEIPEFAVKHAKNVQRSIEVWMCTLGAGIAPNRCEDVRLIWSYLMGSMGNLPVAIRELRSIERRTAEMTGMPDAEMFDDITPEQWMEFCRYVPSFAMVDRQGIRNPG